MHGPGTAKPHLLGSPRSKGKCLHNRENALLSEELRDFPEDSLANRRRRAIGLIPSQEQKLFRCFLALTSGFNSSKLRSLSELHF